MVLLLAMLLWLLWGRCVGTGWAQFVHSPVELVALYSSTGTAQYISAMYMMYVLLSAGSDQPGTVPKTRHVLQCCFAVVSTCKFAVCRLFMAERDCLCAKMMCEKQANQE